MSEFSVNLPPRLPAANAAASVTTAIVPDPPRHLTQLDNGTILKGIVQGRDSEGLLVVSTDKGILKLSTPANLAPGSQVLLEVRATGDRLQVLVLSAEAANSGGQGPTRGTAGAPPPSTGGSAPTPRPAPPPIPVAIAGSVLQGTVVQAAPETLAQLFRALLPNPSQTPAAPAAAQAALQAALHSDTPARALAGLSTAPPSAPAPATALPAEDQGMPAPTAQGGTAPPTTPPPGGTAPAPGATNALPGSLATALQAEVKSKIEALFFGTPAATGALSRGEAPVPQSLETALKLLAALPTGSEVKLRLIAIAPGPGQPVFLPAPDAAAPQVMAGRIVGYTPTGHAVLHSPLGAIVLQGNLAVPVGTELSFALEPAVPVPAGVPAPALPQFLLSLSRGWPGLLEAFVAFRQAGGAADQGAALAHLPQPGPRLAAGMLAAIQALRSGNIEALLGGLTQLRGGTAERDEDIRKLRQEFGQISNLAQDKPGTDWRCCFIPLLDDGTVRQINLFYRRDRGKDRQGEETGAGGTRFIVEVDMSRMGPFQFDGLVREKRFDLMVRSHVTLTAQMREEIAALFQEALALGDYAGNLQFQKVKEFPVSPLEEIEKKATRVSA